jgi:amino acid transporter
MQGYGQGMNYPRTAYLLALIGGILILIGSIISAAIYAVGASILAGVGFGGVAIFLVALAVIALIFGIIVLILALRLKSNPQGAKMTGILIIVFSLISFIGGGGFYIGAILALVGGILALIWNPGTAMPQPGWGQPGQFGQPGQPGQPGQWGQPQQAAWGQPTAVPPSAGGKTCPACGAANAPGAQFCAKCGAALPA